MLMDFETKERIKSFLIPYGFYELIVVADYIEFINESEKYNLKVDLTDTIIDCFGDLKMFKKYKLEELIK